MSRIRILDAMKGICIVFVIISHYSWSAEERLRYLFPFWIDMAVPCFMIISGYVNAMTLEKKNISCFEDAYSMPILLSKWLRFTIPYMMAYVIEMLIYYYVRGIKFSAIEYVFVFMRGGAGAGAYYWPIMMQFVIVFPVIYFIIKKNPVRGLLIALLANIVYELAKSAYSFSLLSYELLLFRYVFLIGFGCFMFLYPQKIKIIWYLIFILIGGISIVRYCYWGETSLVLNYWTRTSFVCTMFIIPIFVIVIKLMGKKGGAGIEIIGRASYNIFLVQMLYYDIPWEYIWREIESRGVLLIINVVICVVVGLIFYVIESRLTKKIMRIINKG